MTIADDISEKNKKIERLESRIEELESEVCDLEDGESHIEDLALGARDALETIVKELGFDISNGKLILEIATEALKDLRYL